MAQEFDIIIYGATGFTGQLATKYLTRDGSGHNLRVAIAGRNEQKLQAISQQCAQRPAVIVAAKEEVGLTQAMVQRTAVILNFAGPFALHAEPIIAACVKFGRHYLDITGESPFIRQMIDRYDAAAVDSGSRLIPFSGFDSVPADLMALIALNCAKDHDVQLDQLSAYYQLRGGLNGGTLASMLNIAKSTPLNALFDAKMLIADPQWSCPPCRRSLPRYEELLKCWSAPFFMGAINQAVVQRSQWLRAQSGDQVVPCAYEEFQIVSRRFTAVTSVGICALLAMLSQAMTTKHGRGIVKRLGPKPGEGSSPAVQGRAWFKARLIGRAGGAAKVVVHMSAKGDPGNAVTVALACESARLAAEGKFSTSRRGFLTPSVAFSSDLQQRLEIAGFKFESKMLRQGESLQAL